MKLCMFTPRAEAMERGWPGRIDGERIVQLAAQTLQAFFTGGGAAREHAEWPLAECDLLAPVRHPPAVRVFRPFELGAVPFFSFRSPYPVLGPEHELRYPDGAGELGFGLALAAVIGADGQIGGFTLANDWTSRDLARAERDAGVGPSKSSDFGFSLGPVVVTPDELGSTRLVARVNGERRVAAEMDTQPWPELVAAAARNTSLRPGDVLIARVSDEGGPSLQPGDVVELEADGIGVLQNRVAA
jgi:2-keto-4-pentenoate hydratase/2-oxohepta-3-ene-1,7-dioic acid hydratase in catechol pathway